MQDSHYLYSTALYKKKKKEFIYINHNSRTYKSKNKKQIQVTGKEHQ